MPGPICSIQGGSALGVPDVCKVPSPAGPVPTPFPNQGQMMMATPPATSVLVAGSPCVNLSSQIPISSGDEAGVAGGVVSNTIVGSVAFTVGSMVVFANGAPVVTLGAMTTHNHNNAVGSVIAPSQSTVIANG